MKISSAAVLDAVPKKKGIRRKPYPPVFCCQSVAPNGIPVLRLLRSGDLTVERGCCLPSCFWTVRLLHLRTDPDFQPGYIRSLHNCSLQYLFCVILFDQMGKVFILFCNFGIVKLVFTAGRADRRQHSKGCAEKAVPHRAIVQILHPLKPQFVAALRTGGAMLLCVIGHLNRFDSLLDIRLQCLGVLHQPQPQCTAALLLFRQIF